MHRTYDILASLDSLKSNVLRLYKFLCSAVIVNLSWYVYIYIEYQILVYIHHIVMDLIENIKKILFE